VCADVTAGIRLPDSVNTGRRLFMYLGSSIGNFDPAQAEAMLADIRANCAQGEGLLIGVDLVKPAATLEAAYDDALGVTAAFNLNLLNHLNALIGANFVVRQWKHRARFNQRHSRVEMHLEARRELLVAWPGGSRRFGEGERIHTENSYKYALPDFTRLLERAGFARVRAWTDDRDWFALCHAVA
jgi:dimethylhistidine N-methyltransferase